MPNPTKDNITGYGVIDLNLDQPTPPPSQIEAVELYLDQVLVGSKTTPDTDVEYQFLVDVRAGDHVTHARARYKGEWKMSDSVHFKAFPTPQPPTPTEKVEVQVTAPQEGQEVPEGQIQFKVSAKVTTS